MALEWFGNEVTQKMERAQVAGINATMGLCVVHAKNNHEWNNQTAVLEGSIKITSPARRTSNGAKGVWGSADVAYALIHEIGGVIKPKNGDALQFRAQDGTFVTVKSVTIPERPYLRPAADEKYRLLAKNIRRSYERGV